MRRVVGWTVFAIALVGLGALILAGTPPTPRWRRAIARASEDVRLGLHLGRDGATALAFVADRGSGAARPPVLWIDAATGREVGRLWDGVDRSLYRPELTADGRWAVTRRGKELHWSAARGPARRRDFGAEIQRVTLAATEPVAYVQLLDNRLLCLDLTADTVTPLADQLVGREMVTADRVVFGTRSGGVIICDARGRRLGAVPGCDREAALSDDGQLLVQHVAGGVVEMWDVSDPARPARKAAVSAQWAAVRLLRDSGRVLIEGRRTEVWDGRSGRLLHEWSLPDPPASFGWSSYQGYRWALFDHSMSRHAYLYDLDSGERRATFDTPPGTHIRLSSRPTQGVLIRSGTGTAFYDAHTGVEVQLPGGPSAYTRDPRIEAAGGQLWTSYHAVQRPEAATWAERTRAWMGRDGDGLVGVEWPSRRPLLRLANTNLGEYAVAPDGRFVLTAHAKGNLVLCRWDVPQPRPWAWAVGVPLALGVGLLRLRAWWLARCAKRAEVNAGIS